MIALPLRLSVVAAVVGVGVGFGFRLVGVSFISFPSFLGSSDSEFVFDLEFIVKNILK